MQFFEYILQDIFYLFVLLFKQNVLFLQSLEHGFTLFVQIF